MKKMIWFGLLGSGLMLSWSMAIAGDYLVVPVQGQQITSWDKKISGASRFQLVLDDEGVLDKETGLVWEKRPCHLTLDPEFCKVPWRIALSNCHNKNIGGRMGWRVPAIEELTSLVDKNATGIKLPEGHPFTGVYWSSYYVSSTTHPNPSWVWLVSFDSGQAAYSDKKGEYYYWCVRGGYGHDGY